MWTIFMKMFKLYSSDGSSFARVTCLQGRFEITTILFNDAAI